MHFKKHALYLSGFFFGRGALFLSPILLANSLVKIDYGQIETSLATSSLLASVLAMGSLGVLPLVVLRENSTATLRGIIGLNLIIVLMCLCLLTFGFIFGYSAEFRLIPLFTAVMVLQSLASTTLKVVGNSAYSLVLDAMLLMLMVIGAYFAKLTGLSAYSLDFIFVLVGFYLSILMLFYLRAMSKYKKRNEEFAFAGLMRMGIPIMLGGFISLLATTSGRFGMGLMAGPLDTADYSILTRVAVLPIVVHQLILVGIFQQLFTEADFYFEKRVLTIVIFVVLSVLMCIFIYPSISFLFGNVFIESFNRNHLAGFWILIQSILWSAIALNDLALARSQLMQRVIPYSLIFMIFALILGWAGINYLGISLYNFVFIHSVVMLGFYVTQSMLMMLLGLNLFKIWSFVTISFLALFFCAPYFPHIT